MSFKLNIISSTTSTTVIMIVWVLLIIGCIDSSLTAGPPKRKLNGHQYRHVVKVGGTLRLACPVEADPRLLVAWTKDDQRIDTDWDDRYRLVTSSLSVGTDSAANNNSSASGGITYALRVRNVTPADAGLYVCKATNGFGTIDIEFRVYVRTGDSNDTDLPPFDNVAEEDSSKATRGQPPKFTNLDRMVQHVTFAAGSNEQLSCSSSGEPKPHVTWYKDGVKLHTTDSGSDYGVTAAEDHLGLILDDVKKSDSGLYQCLVSNSVGNISFTFHVQVIDGASLRPVFVLSDPKNVTVSSGDSASFMCHVRSPTEPRIQWLKRLDPSLESSMDSTMLSDVTIITYDGLNYVVVGSPLTDGDEPRHEMATAQRRDGTYLSKLTIRRTTENDAGQYICSTTNHAGYAYRQAYLTVRTARRRTNNQSARQTGSSVMTSSDSFTIETFVPVVVVSAVLMCFVLIAVVGFAIFWRRRRTTRSRPFRTASTDQALPVSVYADVTSSLPTKQGFVGVHSPDSAFATAVGSKRDCYGGRRNGGRSALLDRNSLNPHRQSNCEAAPLRFADIDESKAVGNRMAASTLTRSRNDPLSVTGCDIGLGGKVLRRSSTAHQGVVATEMQLQQQQSASVCNRTTAGVENVAGASPKSSTLGSRSRLSSATHGAAGVSCNILGASTVRAMVDGGLLCRSVRQQQQELLKN